MIRTFRHKGLELFFTKGDHRKIPADRAARIERMLDRLDASEHPAANTTTRGKDNARERCMTLPAEATPDDTGGKRIAPEHMASPVNYRYAVASNERHE